MNSRGGDTTVGSGVDAARTEESADEVTLDTTAESTASVNVFSLFSIEVCGITRTDRNSELWSDAK